MQDPHALISAYIDCTIDDEGFERLCQWLRESPTNRSTFARAMSDHAAIADWSSERSGGALVPELSKLKETDIERSEWIKLLAALDSKPGQTEVVELVDLTNRGVFQENRGLFIGAGLAAAVLLLGVVLIVSLMGPATTPSTNPIALDDRPPVAPVESTVATLTKTHNATWAESALAPGSQLRAGQRLTLTAGFAEITTNRGAIAILEAPASVELLDNNNAIRLHAGKLVGICETDASKGFVVKTDHTEVADVGTIFGVSISADDATQVQVFQGEVRAAAMGPSGKAQSAETLLEGQALLVRADALPQRAAYEPKRYEQALRMGRKPTYPVLSKVVRHGAIPTSLEGGSQEADALQVFVEHRGFVLDRNVLVDLKGPAQGQGAVTADMSTIPAGVRADVYLLYFDPIDSDRPYMTGEFTVRFDRPVLGVIGYTQALQSSDTMFRLENKQYLVNFTNSGLERDATDRVSIATDGKTLELNLIAGKTYVDQIRVLVAAEDDELDPADF